MRHLTRSKRVGELIRAGLYLVLTLRFIFLGGGRPHAEGLGARFLKAPLLVWPLSEGVGGREIGVGALGVGEDRVSGVKGASLACSLYQVGWLDYGTYEKNRHELREVVKKLPYEPKSEKVRFLHPWRCLAIYGIFFGVGVVLFVEICVDAYAFAFFYVKPIQQHNRIREKNKERAAQNDLKLKISANERKRTLVMTRYENVFYDLSLSPLICFRIPIYFFPYLMNQ